MSKCLSPAFVIRRLGLILATVVLLLGAGAIPTSAASGDFGQVRGADQRQCPDERCSTLNYVPSGSWVQTWCWRDAGWSHGSNRWFRVRYSGADGWVSAMLMSPQPTVPYCSNLLPGEVLFPDQRIWSPNGAYQLVMQGDGNLVLYGSTGAMWSSRTSGQSGNQVVMQGDGNLVLYNTANTAVWYTGMLYPGSRLEMQSDGNVVQYSGSTALWATSWHRTVGQARSTNPGIGGNCTTYAAARFQQFSGYYPALYGDAFNWNDAALADSPAWLVKDSPVTQAIVVFEGNVPPANSSNGHVAWVDIVQSRADGTYIHIWDWNDPGLGQLNQHWVKHVPGGMSYILAPAL